MPASFATWNINSVRLRIGLVLDFLARYQPDVLMLQEIKCTNEQFPAKALTEAGYPADLAAQSPGFGAVLYATAAAWAPNPENPPLYFDMPTKEGIPQPEIAAKFAANASLAFIDQYIGNLRQYKAISIDVGDQDGLRIDAGKLHTILDSYKISNGFEIYNGTHTSAVADRFQNHLMPFFSANLCFQEHCQ